MSIMSFHGLLTLSYTNNYIIPVGLMSELALLKAWFPLVPKKVPETCLRCLWRIFSIVLGSKHKWKRVTGTLDMSQAPLRHEWKPGLIPPLH